MRRLTLLHFPAAVLAAGCFLSGGVASASLIGGNPSFEADAVGVLPGPPTDWVFGQQSPTQSATFEIVTGQGVTDGNQAVKATVTLDNNVNGFTRPLEFFNPGAAPDFSLPIPGMVLGETYTAIGSLTPLTPDALYELQIQDGGPFFSTFTQFPVGQPISTAADPSLVGQTINLATSFVYGGGPITYNVVVIDQTNEFTVNTFELIVDNLRIVPEPNAALLAALASSTGLLVGRRR